MEAAHPVEFGNAWLVTEVGEASATDRAEVRNLSDVQQELTDLRRRCENLTIALGTNRRIATAVGIIMAAHRITDEAAFELLRETSQASHRKLRDVAEDILLSGEVPPPLTATQGRPRRVAPDRSAPTSSG